jgi:hypothetical protein
MSKYYELSEDAIAKFMEIFNKKSFPIGVQFQFMGKEEQKELIKIKKISDEYSYALGKQLMIIINDDLMSVFDDESVTILIEQEIDKISINMESGKIKMIKPDLNTFSSLINKYGVEKVAKANKVEELYQQQVADGKQDDEFIV